MRLGRQIFSLTGWKVGWLVAAPELSTLVARAHQFLTFCTAPNLQSAVAFGLNEGDAWIEPMRQRFTRARDLMAEGLHAAGYAVLDSASTYFLCVDLEASGIGLDDEAFAKLAVERAGCASWPLSASRAGPSAPHRCAYASLSRMDDPPGVAAWPKRGNSPCDAAKKPAGSHCARRSGRGAMESRLADRREVIGSIAPATAAMSKRPVQSERGFLQWRCAGPRRGELVRLLDELRAARRRWPACNA